MLIIFLNMIFTTKSEHSTMDKPILMNQNHLQHDNDAANGTAKTSSNLLLGMIRDENSTVLVSHNDQVSIQRDDRTISNIKCRMNINPSTCRCLKFGSDASDYDTKSIYEEFLKEEQMRLNQYKIVNELQK